MRGRWRLRRRIRHGDGGVYLVDGEAVFSDDGEDLRQEEQGRLTGPGLSLEARQTYLWRFEGPVAQVCFPDGRLFHTLTLGQPRVRVAHACAPDDYLGVHRAGKGAIAVFWRVEGPRKSYGMTSLYTRL